MIGNCYLHYTEYKKGDVCVWVASEDSYKRVSKKRNKPSVISQKQKVTVS